MHLDVAIDEFDDDQLALLAQGGDDRAQRELIVRYRRFARSRMRGWFLVGGDADDLEQEALIGLYKAIRDYSPEREASFHAFAALCVTRQVISAIKAATRQKHQPLNAYVSISGVRGSDDPGEQHVEDLLFDHAGADPADTVVGGQRMDDLREAIDRLLTDLEIDVLKMYVAGVSYVEIGERLGRQVKSIDNAIQRIKRKVDTHLRADEDLAFQP